MPSQNNLESVFYDTANAIRSKRGTTATMKPIDFADQINLITGGCKEEVILNATHNGTFYPPEGKVYNKAIVNTPEPKQELKLTATTNSIYMPPSGFVYNEVEVNVPSEAPSVLKEFRIDRSLPGDPYNKIITATDYDCDGFSKVVVNLPRPKNEEIAVIDLNLYSGDQTVLPNTNGVFTKAIIHKPTTLMPYNIKKGINIAGVIGTLETGSTIKLQPEKTVNPKTSKQTITADTGYDGLSSVVVNPVNSSIDPNIKSENIKSGISILGVIGTAVPSETVEYSFDELSFSDASDYCTVNTSNALGYYILLEKGDYSYSTFIPTSIISYLTMGTMTDPAEIYIYSNTPSFLKISTAPIANWKDYTVKKIYALRERG